MFGRKIKIKTIQAELDLAKVKHGSEVLKVKELKRFLDEIVTLEPSIGRFRTESEDGWGFRFAEWAFDDVHDFVTANAADKRHAELKARFEGKDKK